MRGLCSELWVLWRTSAFPLPPQLGRDWSKAGPGGGTRAASLAHALRVSLVRSMRSTDAMLAAWRGKLARAMEAVGFAAEADKESR